MKRRRVVQLTALGGLTLPLAGCTDEAADDTGNETANDTGNETANDTDTDTETSADGNGDDEEGEDDESADEPEDQEFSGSGNDAIEDVTIEGGLTVIDATYESSSDESDDEEGGDDESDGDENADEDDSEDEFEVRLIPEERLAEGDQDGENESDTDNEQNATDDEAENDADDGENADDESEDEPETVVFVKSEFVDSSGEYEGQTAHPVVEGTYVLSVVADGDWEVTVSQPRDESGDEPPISIDGSGNEVHGPFEFDGSYQPSGEYEGERIIADIYPITDDPVFVFHDGSIEDPSEFEFEGVGYLSVKSDDEWTIEIE